MKVKIIRGTNEIGGSCIKVSTDNTELLLDIGESLKGEKLVLVENNIIGILISHAHQDHYGELELIPNATVYSGKDTKTLIYLTRQFTGKKALKHNWQLFENAKPFYVGDIKVTPYLIDHSACDSYMFLLENSGKSILYTGDFRLFGRKSEFAKKQIEKLPKNIDLCICEGTTLLRTDMPENETDIENKLVEVFKKDSPIFINASAQNIDRIVSITRACKRTEKTFVIDPYAAYVFQMLENKNIPNANFECIRVFYPMRLSKRIAEFDKTILYRFVNKKINADELNTQLNKSVMLVRSSMRSDLMIRLKSIEKSIFIHSMWEGYWKDEKNDIFRNFIESKCMEVLQIHTSGHAYKKEIKWLIDTVKPKKVMPVHTENAKGFEELGLTCEIVYNENEL